MDGAGRISRFGAYSGFTEALFDGVARRSGYHALPDGRQLAYDVLLPTRGGQPSRERLPVLFHYTPYLRATRVGGTGWFAEVYRRRVGAKDGDVLDQVANYAWLKRLLAHGYAVVAVELPGTGASTGTMTMDFRSYRDEANQLLDWIAAQPWSNGRVGMFGQSFAAITQYAAAAAGNPHLRAIVPISSPFDLYDMVYPGGVFNTGFDANYTRITAELEDLVDPVAEDEGGQLLERARRERQGATLSSTCPRIFRAAPLRDGAIPGGPRVWGEQLGLHECAAAANSTGVAVYNGTGWTDLFTRDAFLLHANLRLPRRLMVRPQAHVLVGRTAEDVDFGAEVHRWFDYWLKGVANGVMDEAPVWYFVTGREKDAWRSASTWPPPTVGPREYHLHPRAVATGDGELAPARPARKVADRYRVDPTASSGVNSRWNITGAGVYAPMTENDGKVMTYTTAPLVEDTVVAGHPCLRLWIATPEPDVDLFAYLEDVDEAGVSRYVSEGHLRASHRAIAPPPYANLGLHYHPSTAAKLAPLPANEPVELRLDLLPVAHCFRAGHRIRIAVAGADADNFASLTRPGAEIAILMAPETPTALVLPVDSSGSR